MWYQRIGPPAPQIKLRGSYDATKGRPVRVNQYPVSKRTYKPEFLAKVNDLDEHQKDLDEHQIEVDPGWYCDPPGFPRIGPPQKIVQTAKAIVFLYNDLSGNFFRVGG